MAPKPDKKTDAQRRAAHAARSKRNQHARVAAGGRNMRFILDAPANAALQRLMRASGMTATGVIAKALLYADAQQTARDNASKMLAAMAPWERHDTNATPH